MGKARGSKPATPMTPQLRVGKASSAPLAVASETFAQIHVTGRCIGVSFTDQ
jgi:hypothetical protein